MERTAVTIDGSHGEGGGQILRTSLTLSILTGRPLIIEKIRAGRSKPGLQPQHLASVKAAAALSRADLEGAAVGSTLLGFIPRTPAVPGSYHFDIGTAGAATLVAQTVMIPLALADAPSDVTITGGTHVPFALMVDYLEYVYAEVLADHGPAIAVDAPSAGFFPRGGGSLRLAIEPSRLNRPVTLVERGALQTVTAHVITSGLPPDVARRGEAALRERLQGLPIEVAINSREVSSPGPGAAVFLMAICETGRAGFSATSVRGKPVEAVGGEACEDLLAWFRSGAACEEHLADQLVLPMALTPGLSQWTTSRVTEHLRTMLWLLPQFLGVEVSLTENTDGSGTVTVCGGQPPYSPMSSASARHS